MGNARAIRWSGLLPAGLLVLLLAPGPAFPQVASDSGGWDKTDTVDGIEIYRREVPGSPVIAFRGEGRVDAPISRVASVLLDEKRSPEWVDSVEESRLIKMYGEREFLQYTHVGTPFIIQDRDFLSRGRIEADLREGTMTLFLKAAEDPAMPEGRYVRGALDGRWVLRSVDHGAGTWVIAEMHADPKGDVPKWLVNSVQKSWPRNTLESLRRQVAKADIRIIPQVSAVFGDGKGAVTSSAH